MLVVVQWVGHRGDGLIPGRSVSRKEVELSGKQGERSKIGGNAWDEGWKSVFG